MPELPEVEILVRHLDPLLRGKRIRTVQVLRSRVIRPTREEALRKALCGRTFRKVRRRGKYLVFELTGAKGERIKLIGHLGMTGRFYLSPASVELPKHAAIVLGLAKHRLVFEDTRYFGRLTLDESLIASLGPEPLDPEFNVSRLAEELGRSRLPIKVKLLDQSLLAGIGNIYASEALFIAGIAPTIPSRRLKSHQIHRLVRAMQQVLADAIRRGSTIPLNFAGACSSDGLFYFGRVPGARDSYEERLRVYDRADQPCPRCGTKINRIVQSARSTFYCPRCQRG